MISVVTEFAGNLWVVGLLGLIVYGVMPVSDEVAA